MHTTYKQHANKRQHATHCPLLSAPAALLTNECAPYMSITSTSVEHCRTCAHRVHSVSFGFDWTIRFDFSLQTNTPCQLYQGTPKSVGHLQQCWPPRKVLAIHSRPPRKVLAITCRWPSPMRSSSHRLSLKAVVVTPPCTCSSLTVTESTNHPAGLPVGDLPS